MSYITTYSGKHFSFIDLKSNEIDIDDIAWALSHQSRFAGHCNVFYSIAEHCILVSQNCKSENALVGLLHDASEAYMCDLPSPLKRLPSLLGYCRLERCVQAVILQQLGLDSKIPDDVHQADKRICEFEKAQFFDKESRIDALSPKTAYFLYLERFKKLYVKQ